MLTGARVLALAPVVLAALLLTAAAPAPDAPSPAALAPVAIIDVVIVPDPVQSGKDVSITIHTTPNAVQVQGRVLGHRFVLPKTGDGVFYGSGKVPWWARFFHGALNVTFVASDESGATSQMEHTIRM